MVIFSGEIKLLLINPSAMAVPKLPPPIMAIFLLITIALKTARYKKEKGSLKEPHY